MREIKTFSKKEAKRIKYFLCDIDDTITTDGKLTAAAYDAVWRLTEAGIDVIPVTGRPAGWCDAIVRQWPVKAVIGENGAFATYVADQQLQLLIHPKASEESLSQLGKVWAEVEKKFPLARVSKDQFCRKFDLAIDFAEDPPVLEFSVAREIAELCRSLGAEAKVSSIHVNTWFGSYDKVSMSTLFLEKILGATALQESVFFIGDSPNDSPLFGYFAHSCGVANIRAFLPSLAFPPTYVTEQASGSGFVEAVDCLLAAREG